MSDWKNELRGHFRKPNEVERPAVAGVRDPRIHSFIEDTVRPAFEELKIELEKYGREIWIAGEHDPLWLQVRRRGVNEFRYGVYVVDGLNGPYPVPFSEVWEVASGKLLRGEGLFRPGVQDYGVSDVGKEEIIRHFTRSYLVDANPS